MLLKMFKSKINGAIVTSSNVDYEGSIEIDRNIMDAANIHLYECVWIWNVTNGNRLMTYVLEAPKGSQKICPNGAAALQCSEGDKLVITAFTEITEIERQFFQPTVVNLDGRNFIGSVKQLPIDGETPAPHTTGFVKHGEAKPEASRPCLCDCIQCKKNAHLICSKCLGSSVFVTKQEVFDMLRAQEQKGPRRVGWPPLK